MKSKSPWSVKSNSLKDLEALKDVVKGYPTNVTQDALATRKPTTAVISDMLPAVIPQKPMPKAPAIMPDAVYPKHGAIIQDGVGGKPNFTINANNYDVPAVVQAPKSYHGKMSYPKPGEILQAGDNYTPNFRLSGNSYGQTTNQLPVVYQEPVKQAAHSATSMMDDVAKAAAPVMDDVAMAGKSAWGPLAKRTAMGIAKSGVASAALPGPMDIMFPEHANAGEGEEVKRMLEQAKYARNPAKPDAELMRMLGMPVPDKGMSQVPPAMALSKMPDEQAQALAYSNQMDGQDEETAQDENDPNDEPEVPGTLGGGGKMSEGGRYGGRFINANDDTNLNSLKDSLTDDVSGDQYRKLVTMQQNAIGAKMQNKSAASYMDLSPAMALVDQLTGSRLANSYHAPRGAEADMANMNALSKQLADYDNDKQKNKIALLAALNKNSDKANPYELAMFRHQLASKLADKKAALGLADGGFKPKEVVAVREKFDKNDRNVNIDTMLNFNQKLDAYKEALNEMGGDNFLLTGDKKDKLDRTYNDLLVSYNKDEAKLGALAGGDLNILKGVLKPVTGGAGLLNATMGGGARTARQAIDDFQARAKGKAQSEIGELSKVYGEGVSKNLVGDLVDMKKSKIDAMSGGAKGKSKASSSAEQILREKGLIK